MMPSQVRLCQSQDFPNYEALRRLTHGHQFRPSGVKKKLYCVSFPGRLLATGSGDNTYTWDVSGKQAGFDPELAA
jgi:hypothetical protein